MIRKTISQYECCKTMLTANMFVESLKNCDKRNSKMLYRYNVFPFNADYQPPESRSLTRMHANIHCTVVVVKSYQRADSVNNMHFT